MLKKMSLSCVVALCLNAPVWANIESCAQNKNFIVGTGKYDITGPAAEQGMMGYGMLRQKTAGIYQRLWARAISIASPCNGKKIVLVNVDLGQVFQGIKLEVIKKLQNKYGQEYTEKNVLITATHTHSGPGGYSTYTFYNLTTLGFNRDNFDVIVNGIVQAVSQAHDNAIPANIKFNAASLHGISHNRSPNAYLQNQAQERARFKHDYNPEMMLLRFEDLSGSPIAMMNWFALHGVSLNNKNLLISGDNKGYAEYLFEQDYPKNVSHQPFVAAFAQGNAGDISPNPLGHEGGARDAGLKAVETAGEAQYRHAKTLFDEAHTHIVGGVDYRHQYVAMDQVLLETTRQEVKKTCTAAIGVSMLAGTQDGEGIGQQGVTCETLKSTLPQLVCEASTNRCQGKKPIAVTTGNKFPYPWTPNILPFQVIKIGQFIIAAVPFEITTMAGRRIETSLHQLPGWQENPVVVATLSNAYAGYVTTKEEYQIQRYEGASTHFGPNTLKAIQQTLRHLGQALIFEKPTGSGPMPLDLVNTQLNLQPGVVYDSTPLGKHFGDVFKNVTTHYKPGDHVEVIFWGAHPKNNFRTNHTFLEVQWYDAGVWKTIRNDNDWDTEYHWQRKNLADSLIRIVWRIPAETKPGLYRIVHYGDAKSFWGGKITSYIGYSGQFKVS